MSAATLSPTPAADAEVRALHRQIIEAWNRRDAARFAAAFADDAIVIGFDGSQMDGRAAVEQALAGIFARHQPPAYVAQVREVRLLAPGVGLLLAVAGMVPPGKADINPALNALQSLVAVEREGRWQAVLFQNTPAQFLGRPEAAAQLSAELSRLLPVR